MTNFERRKKEIIESMRAYNESPKKVKEFMNHCKKSIKDNKHKSSEVERAMIEGANEYLKEIE